MTVLTIFIVTFVSVFLLGFQSLIVNSGKVWVAMINSFLIGCAQLFLLKVIPGSTVPFEVLAYLIAGPLAVPCAMFIHSKFFKKDKNEDLS